MLKNCDVLLDLLMQNLQYAADSFHAGGLAHGFAVAALALVHVHELAFALWLAALSLAFAIASLRAVRNAWCETKRELEKQPGAPASRRRVARSRRSKPPAKRKNRKTKRLQHH